MKPVRATLVLLTLAGGAAAQSRTTLVDAPLAVLMSMPEEEVQALQSDFRQALARHDAVLLPTRSSWKKAVSAVGREDCNINDACLQQLALTSGSLYALFASVERNAAGTELMVTGRVVNREGGLARPRVQLTRADTGRASVLAALQQLLVELQLDTLPAVLAFRPGEALPAPPPPPLLLPERPPAPAPTQVAAWVTLGVAVSATATSLAFGVKAASQLHGLPADGRFISEEQARRQVEGNRAASIALGTGLGAGALLATSLGFFLLSGPVQVGAGPTGDGGAVFASGRF